MVRLLPSNLTCSWSRLVKRAPSVIRAPREVFQGVLTILHMGHNVLPVCVPQGGIFVLHQFNKRNCANTNVTFYKAWACAIVNMYQNEQIRISSWEWTWLGYKKQLLSISLQPNFFYPSSDDWSLSILSMTIFPCSGALIAPQFSTFT